MTDKAISPLRRRLIEDMTIRQLGPKTSARPHYRLGRRRYAGSNGRGLSWTPEMRQVAKVEPCP